VQIGQARELAIHSADDIAEVGLRTASWASGFEPTDLDALEVGQQVVVVSGYSGGFERRPRLQSDLWGDSVVLRGGEESFAAGYRSPGRGGLASVAVWGTVETSRGDPLVVAADLILFVGDDFEL
jgi:hypothetical protein